MDELKITTLIENIDDLGQLLYEQGYRIHKTDERIFYLNWRNGDFIKMPSLFNKSLDKLDYCIISHGHMITVVELKSL